MNEYSYNIKNRQKLTIVKKFGVSLSSPPTEERVFFARNLRCGGCVGGVFAKFAASRRLKPEIAIVNQRLTSRLLFENIS